MLNKAITKYIGDTRLSPILLENYKYDSNNNLIEQSINNQKYNFFYKNDFNKTLDYISFDSFKFYPLFDANNRYIGKEIYNNTNLILKEFITYYKVGDHSTSLPQCISFNNKDNLQYKYNSNGFITEINHNGHLYSKYSYDGNNLIREDNKILNKTIIFTYDNNGNILSRHEYPFSNDDLSSYECNHFNYVYDKDKLLSYNNEICKYNSLGNPIIYRNKDVLWKYGKYLIKYGDLSFTYDGNGRRISKGNITYSYDSNGRLIKQSNGLEFIYDSTGLIGFKYNNNTYFYQKDIQSNITSIIDNNGEGFWSGFVNGVADGAMWGGIFSLVSAGIGAIKYTRGFRVVGLNEYDDIARTGKFASNGFSEGKYFWSSKSSAKAFVSKIGMADGTYRIVGSRISRF